MSVSSNREFIYKRCFQILARMNESSQDKWRNSADETTSELEELVSRIKNVDVEAEVDRAVKCYEECVKRVDSIIADLKY